MPKARANGIEIEYETLGDPAGRPLLLIMGLGGQLIAWDDAFCQQLARRGHFVIRYDNRDVGLSTKFDSAGPGAVPQAAAAMAQGQPVQAAYTLDDMADDAAGLLAALGLRAAHVVGISMGGMIAQVLAARHPAKVLTLTSIMSTTGNPTLPPPRPEALTMLLTPPPRERAGFIEHYVRTFRVLSGPGFPYDADRVARRAGLAFDRCFYPVGVSRQAVAVVAAGDRREKLAKVRAPALVIHGTADPLIPAEAGRDTAASIPGAELILIDGMGHDLPEGAWPQLIDAISRHAARLAA